jgi:branched-chain amino acid transport system permease protein
MRPLYRDLLLAGLLAVLLAFLPELLKARFERAAVSYLTIASNALILGILALTWDIVGRTGQLSLAHAAFFGAGAYTTAILVRNADAPLWLGLPLAAVVGALMAFALGRVTLRLRGIYFAIATLAFTEVLKAVVQQLPTRIAGGAAGINVTPLFRPQFIAGEMERWEVAFIRNQNYFLLYAALLLLCVIVSVILQHSRFRFAFTAIRTNEEVAAVMGVSAAYYKVAAFMISSALVATLGALEAHRIGSVSPDGAFGVHVTVLALVTPIFGGLYTTVGPIIGAATLSGLEEWLRRTFESGYLIGYGLVLVLSIMFMPRGVVGLAGQLWRARRRRGREEDR